MRKPGRLIWRSSWLAGELAFALGHFLILFLRTRGRPSLRQRAECLHRHCRRVLRVFVDRVTVSGPLPTAGLLVTNHQGYLDILLLSSLVPCVFVSKHEIRRWPLFGWFAMLGGTVFVQRAKRGEVGTVGEQIRARLAAGELVALFPEGTTSNGQGLLPFKSSLLEPAVGRPCPLFVACLGYALPGGVVADDVCYWGDMTLFPHAVNLLMKPYVQAEVRFAEFQQPAPDRKTLARQLQAEVARLKAEAKS